METESKDGWLLATVSIPPLHEGLASDPGLPSSNFSTLCSRGSGNLLAF